LARTLYVPTCGRYPHTLDDTCSAFPWLNLTNHFVVRFVSCTLSIGVINMSFFFFSLSFLISLLPPQNCWLVFLFFWYLWFSYSSFNLLFLSPFLVRVLFPFNAVLQFHYVICYAFQFDFYSFDFFTWSFYISFFSFNFTLQSKFILCYYF